jgi:hypothetical protein
MKEKLTRVMPITVYNYMPIILHNCLNIQITYKSTMSSGQEMHVESFWSQSEYTPPCDNYMPIILHNCLNIQITY